jgi:signal transduction histidine kinase/ActR/RegA family two-component response regulator
MQQGKSSVGPIVKGRTIGVPAVPMCVPILGIHGDRIGILVGVTDLTRPNFLDRFPLVAMGRETSVNLVDRPQRTIISSSDKSRIMQPLPVNPVFEGVMAEGGGFRVGVNSKQTTVLFSVARIPPADWFISIYTPAAVAFGPAYKLQERLLWTLAFVTLLIGLLHWYLIRSQLKPILGAISAISRLTEAGKGDLRLPITGRDEVAELMVSFNQLLQVREDKEKERLRYEAISSTNQRLESLGILAGGIAHDFNNLLTGIFGNVQLAKLETSEPDVQAHLDRTMRSLERATALTRQLMTFSREDSPVLAVGDVFAVVEETVKFTLSGSSVAVTVQRQGAAKPVKFDKHQMAQVIENLALNALQAMPDGGALRVLVSSHVSENGTEVVVIELTDSGPGMPPETLERIFEPFFTTKPEGHGLGLAMCRSIVARHGGRIAVQSVVGQGTTFRIEVPTTADAPGTVPDAESAVHSGHGKVLVMDDEKDVADVVCEMLEQLGYETVYCDSGQRAAEIFGIDRSHSHSIRAVFLDLTVPGGLGGLDTLRLIQRIDSKVPVYAISGFAAGEVIANPGRFGFAGFLAKPFLLGDLKRLLADNPPTA